MQDEPSIIEVQLRELEGTKSIFLRVRSREALARLSGLFERLSESKLIQCSAAGLTPPLFHLPPELKDVLFLVVDTEANNTSLLEAKRGTLTWARHTEGWLECAEKVKALLLPLLSAAHQYLGRGGSAEIEVSYKEG